MFSRYGEKNHSLGHDAVDSPQLQRPKKSKTTHLIPKENAYFFLDGKTYVKKIIEIYHDSNLKSFFPICKQLSHVFFFASSHAGISYNFSLSIVSWWCLVQP